MDKTCDACEFLQNPVHQILVTEYWTIGVGNDHPYLGRAFATLKTHRGSVSELTAEELVEFQANLGKLERAYKTAFGADVLNIECNMNHAFKSEPFNPHVHWHIYPRYKTAPEVAGVVFDDPLFGEHIDEDLVRIVSDEVVETIVTKLRQNMPT